MNLRFYVRRIFEGEVRRGVVFIKELVPRHMITLVARSIYNENYFTVPMTHHITDNGGLRNVQYQWKYGGQSHTITSEVFRVPPLPKKGSEVEFILVHYWGYSSTRKGETIEYEVAHPPWRVWDNPFISIGVDYSLNYDLPFAQFLNSNKYSAYIARDQRLKCILENYFAINRSHIYD